MNLSRTVSQINGDFSRKSRIFFTSVYLTEGFPVGIWYGRKGKKTRMTELPDDRKSFKIGLAVQTQYRRVSDRHATTAKTSFTHSFAREKM